MIQINEFVNKLTTQLQAQPVQHVMELKPLLEYYNGFDWINHIEIEVNVPKTIVLFQNEQVKVLLEYWPGYQQNKQSKNLKTGGLLKVLSGQLTESRLDLSAPGKVTEKLTYQKGDIIYITEGAAYQAVEYPVPYSAFSLAIYLSDAYRSKSSTQKTVATQR